MACADGSQRDEVANRRQQATALRLEGGGGGELLLGVVGRPCEELLRGLLVRGGQQVRLQPLQQVLAHQQALALAATHAASEGLQRVATQFRHLVAGGERGRGKLAPEEQNRLHVPAEQERVLDLRQRAATTLLRVISAARVNQPSSRGGGQSAREQEGIEAPLERQKGYGWVRLVACLQLRQAEGKEGGHSGARGQCVACEGEGEEG